jgi:ABC-type lipoprotein export system ATPase subunit
MASENRSGPNLNPLAILAPATLIALEPEDGSPVVDDVSFAVGAGEILGLVGEWGSGKTTLALALLGYARPGCRIAGGEVEIAGRRLTGVSEAEARSHRGRVVSYVPQDPPAALSPSLRVGDVVADMLRAHAPGSGADEGAVVEGLRRVDLPAVRAFARRFPHELSGGQQQRVAIAASLVRAPARRAPPRVLRCETEAPPSESAGTAYDVRCFEWRRTPPGRAGRRRGRPRRDRSSPWTRTSLSSRTSPSASRTASA